MCAHLSMCMCVGVCIYVCCPNGFSPRDQSLCCAVQHCCALPAVVMFTAHTKSAAGWREDARKKQFLLLTGEEGKKQGETE